MTTSWATAAREVPGLDHDPCPGDVPAVRRLAGDLRVRADGVGAAADVCRAWEPYGWRGDAGREARWAVGGLADHLEPVRRSFDAAADVLLAWAGELDAMQAEAARLGAEAQELHRRQLLTTLAAGVPATPSDVVALQHRLSAERRALQERVDELHARWLAASRRRSADLDDAAPPTAGAWRGTWDAVHDWHQTSVRRSARQIGWVAGGAELGSVAAGLVALVPPAAPVAVPVSAGLGGLAAEARVVLATGADGSPDDVKGAVVGVAAGAATGGLGKLAERGGPLLRKAADRVGTATDDAVLAQDLASLAGLRGDGEAPGALAGLDGGTVAVTVHDSSSPWHVGHGLRGEGFVGVAVVPVTVAGRPAAARPSPPPAPAPRGQTTTRPPRHVGAGASGD